MTVMLVVAEVAMGIEKVKLLLRVEFRRDPKP